MTVVRSWDAELWFDRAPGDGPPDARFLLQEVSSKGPDLNHNTLTSCVTERPTQFWPQTLDWPRTDSDVAVEQLTIPCDPSIRISSFRWRGVDTNADGELDAIEGSGEALRLPLTLDPTRPPDPGPVMKVELRARPDGTPPTLRVPVAAHPLDSLVISASEPLSAESLVLLAKPSLSYSMTVQPEPSSPQGPLYQFRQETILPLGETWQVQATGNDAAGLPLKGPYQALTTLRDPGIFPQDGFESSGVLANPSIVLSGDARVVQNHREKPAIRGNWSLLINGSGEATLHLVRQPCQRYVRWVADFISGGDSPGSMITAGVIGGVRRAQAYIDRNRGVGEPQEQHLRLEDEGTDVIVRFAIDSQCVPAAYCERTRIVMIDDVRIE